MTYNLNNNLWREKKSMVEKKQRNKKISLGSSLHAAAQISLSSYEEETEEKMTW